MSNETFSATSEIPRTNPPTLVHVGIPGNLSARRLSAKSRRFRIRGRCLGFVTGSACDWFGLASGGNPA